MIQQKLTEHHLQCMCVDWFKASYSNKLIFAIPNGGARSKATGAMLKKEGVVKGIPDLFIPEPTLNEKGLWIEMKIKGNYPSEEQKIMMKNLESNGYQCNLCYTFEDFCNIVNDYFQCSRYPVKQNLHTNK